MRKKNESVLCNTTKRRMNETLMCVCTLKRKDVSGGLVGQSQEAVAGCGDVALCFATPEFWRAQRRGRRDAIQQKHQNSCEEQRITLRGYARLCLKAVKARCEVALLRHYP